MNLHVVWIDINIKFNYIFVVIKPGINKYLDITML
jgi:hypothetical protein